MKGKAMLALLALLLAGCGAAPMRGANLLPHRAVPLDDPRAARSLQRLAQAGADTVAFVPFLRQPDGGACALEGLGEAGREALGTALRTARGLGLRLALKPQIVVAGTWHGRIRMTSEADWACWFAAYGAELEALARLAQREGAALLVAGTELKGTERRPEWRRLVGRLRKSYSGEIAYVFHDRDDVLGFSASDLLDSVGFTLYPPLGEAADRASLAIPIGRAAAELRDWTATQDKPVWIAEVGIGSRAGAQRRPWEWDEEAEIPRVPDLRLQARVIDLWLQHLDGPWNRGVWVWNWFSDPDAGGPADTDFTLQNKPAEAVLACRWAGRCPEARP